MSSVKKRPPIPKIVAPKRAESELSAPVGDYLTSLGFTVRAEVRHCDITATLDDVLVVVELKTAFNIDLLTQAVERQSVADAVYVGLPADGTFAKSSRFDKRRRGIETVLRRLGIGLLLVHFGGEDTDAPPRVERVHDAGRETVPQTRKKKRAGVLREIAGRSGDYNVGGTTGVKRTTAYREQAIFLAVCLEMHGASSPTSCCVRGATRKAGAILLRNVYGWFVCEKRGVYSVAPHAIAEIARDWEPALSAQRARVANFAAR